MKIVMITSWDRDCGIYFYTRPLVEELERQGHQLEVICHTNARPDIRIHPIIGLERADWFEAVEAEVARISPDVVHLQFEYGLYSHQTEGNFFSYSAADAFSVNDLLFRWKVEGRPTAVTMHSDNSDRPDRQAFIKTMGELPSITFVHTRYGPIPSGKVAFMPHAAPAAAGIKPHKARHGWQGKKVVGMIGYPDWYKRYERVVALWPDIVSRSKEPAMLVAACAPRPGSKEGIVLGDALEQAIAASPARDSIVYLPKLFSPEEFLEVVASFDVLVLPYLSAAASGPCMAACATGTPVVASLVGGLRSYLEDSGGAGIGVSPTNDRALVRAVANVLNDDTLRAALSVKARRYARRVSLPNIARRHATFYRWAIRHRGQVTGRGR